MTLKKILLVNGPMPTASVTLLALALCCFAATAEHVHLL